MVGNVLKRIKEIDLRKGGSTFFEFAFCGLFLVIILMIMVGLFIKRYTAENLDLAADQLSRDIVVCASVQEAEDLINQRLGDFMNLKYVDSIDIDIDYVPGSNTEWKKGSFIRITYFAKVDSALLWKSTTYTNTITRMLENTEREDN